jgi:hypothetical protein
VRRPGDDDGWRYYLPDGEERVRQLTALTGAIVSVWRFDPDGGVLEGPQGPVTHLLCANGGVYDWSTGLIYQNGRYFDPMLGIWLAMTPLLVMQSWRRKGKRSKHERRRILLAVLGVALLGVGLLAGCNRPMPTPTPTLCPDEVPTLRSLTVETGSINLYYPKAGPEGDPFLRFGDALNTVYGAKFTAVVDAPARAQGQLEWVQNYKEAQQDVCLGMNMSCRRTIRPGTPMTVKCMTCLTIQVR